MKSKDFVVIKENIVDAAQHMQKDHEVQMARAQLYSAAEAAIDIHRMLRSVSEQEGLEGWVSAKITLAQDYLNTIREYLKYENTDDMAPPSFDAEQASDSLDDLLGENMTAGAVSTVVMPMPKQANPFKRRKIKEQTPAAPGQPAPAGQQPAAGAAPAPGQPPKPGQPAPAGQQPAAPAKPGQPAPAAGAAPAPGQPPKPGQPAPAAGAAPAPGQPPKPGQPAPAGQQPAAPAKPGQPAPTGTATPPNPAQVKKDTDTLAGLLNNPANPLNTELQALLKKAAALPK